MPKNIFLSLLAGACLFAGFQSAAQTEKTVTIKSSILGESRELLTYSPPSTTVKLPLVIVFDGEGLFDITLSALRFMNYNSEMPQLPETMVVGIKNTNRNRDMPIPQEYGQGGEEKFAGFVKNELLPFLHKQYSLNGHTILIGHSQGAYFATYLFATDPASFRWIIALDAPMNVDEKANDIKRRVQKAFAIPGNKFRYASLEASYGWGNFFPAGDQFAQEKFENESHESMPYKGIYDGLKFLYKDFSPPRKDLNLVDLKEHYKNISEKYGYTYEIPLRVLTASASRKMQENRKTEILELLDYADDKYGGSKNTSVLREKAAELTEAKISIADSFLALSKATPAEIEKYAGKWNGQFISKDGKAFDISIEIKIDNNKAKLLFAPDPNAPANKLEAEILHVNSDDKLIYGFRNRGGGIIVNTFSLTGKNTMTGEGWWLGFSIPADAPAEVRNQLNFLLTTPTRFKLERE